MFVRRNLLLASAIALSVLSAAARVEAVLITEPNNTPAKATILDTHQFVIQDSLSGIAGRPDTLIATYDPAFKHEGVSNDNGSPLGNGMASALFGVSLTKQGGAYFKVSGAGDVDFDGSHTQSGRYFVDFNVYDKDHNFIKTVVWANEDVAPHMVDNVWLDPPDVPDPRLIGGTVDAIVNNILGPGTGDAMDFFTFSGLVPNMPFTATLTVATFHPLLGLYKVSDLSLISTSDPQSTTATITGVANGQGKALIGVTGAADTQFKGEHLEAGNYTLVVSQVLVPEPSTTVLASLGGALAALFSYRRRRRLRLARARARLS